MRTAPEGAALWTPAPRRGGVLCGQHQRALPSGLPPLAGAASYADGTKGRCPLDSRWGFTPDPEMLRISASPAGGTKDFGAAFSLLLC